MIHKKKETNKYFMQARADTEAKRAAAITEARTAIYERNCCFV